MNDSFALSIGQAQQLEFAFKRNDWTAEQVHVLCKEDILARVLEFMEHRGKIAPSRDWVVMTRPIAEKLLGKEVNHMALYELFCDTPIEELFTDEIALAHGWTSLENQEVVKELRSSKHPDRPSVTTVGELIRLAVWQFLLLGRQKAYYIDRVLQSIGLTIYTNISIDICKRAALPE